MSKKTKKKPVEPRGTVLRTVEIERKRYVNGWSKNSEKFLNEGHYDWMEGYIAGCSKVIEVGTGDGKSTLSLVNRNHSVVGIDENPICLKKAAEFLSSQGKKVTYEKRESKYLVHGGYRVEYNRIKSNPPLEGEVLLLEGDILNDRNLIDWLKQNGPYDAMVCWLIGSHGGRQQNEAIMAKTPGAYRLHVQNRVYEIADEVLKSGGLLNIVDRTEAPKDDAMREDFLNSHRDQASVTSIEVISIDFRKYEEPQDGIKMGVTVPLSGKTSTMDEVVLMSVLSRKP